MVLMSDGEVTLERLAVEINAAHALVLRAARTSLEHAMTAGTLLIEAKALVPHGHWLPWLLENCATPESTARLYMQLARDLPARLDEDKSLTVSDLGIREARALLAEPRAAQLPDPPLWERLSESASDPVAEDEERPSSGRLRGQWEEMSADMRARERHLDEMRTEHRLLETMEAERLEEVRQKQDAAVLLTPAQMTEEEKAQALYKRFKREDVMCRALTGIEHMLRFDPAEAAGIHSRHTPLLRHLMANDVATIREALAWFQTYVEILTPYLGDAAVRRGDGGAPARQLRAVRGEDDGAEST